MAGIVDVPPRFWAVRYDAALTPGASADIEAGANCQRFAYEVLRHNGGVISDFRSSDLWADTRETERVTELAPLDLLLFNAAQESYGAHVALFLGEERAIHLCKRLGAPAVWTLAEFAAEPAYRCFIGAKRVKRIM